MTTIQGTNYKLIAPLEDSPEYIINPFDFNGNLIPEMIIAIDTSNGRSCQIFLPELTKDLPNSQPFDFYNTDGQTNFTLKFIKVSSDFTPVDIICSQATTLSGELVPIGGLQSVRISKPKDTVELTPIGLATDNTYQVLLNAQGVTPA